MPKIIQAEVILYGAHEIHLMPNRKAQLAALRSLSQSYDNLADMVSSFENPNPDVVQKALKEIENRLFTSDGKIY